MSHATVLVISKKNDNQTIDKIMYPYWELDLSLEDLIKDPRAVFSLDYTIEQAKEEQKKAIERHPESNYDKMTLEQFMEEWDGCKLKEDGFGHYRNPNYKWDWYEIGGRWAGRIKLKNGKQGKIGRKSFMMEGDPYSNGNVDSAQIKDIDEDWLKKFTSYAVLNEEGWYEKSRLGWFGVSIYEKYCCVAEELTIREVLDHFKHDYFGISKAWKGISNDYIIDVLKILYDHYTKEGKVFKLKNNLGNGKTEITEGLKQCEFFRDQHWNKNFHKRFIEKLDPEMFLTFVDYHI